MRGFSIGRLPTAGLAGVLLLSTLAVGSSCYASERAVAEAGGGGAEEGHGGAGTPNRLIHESSPYLRLHAYNPVEWYPWGEEALARARREDKPIFLSVGYSTCYWCHVMEREVFSNPEIAELMNRWFISIKVDREERPDLDEIYMTATQLLTRHGGWPNSVFLTPDLEPFFAGTYFPPEDRYGRPGFPTVLEGLHRAWSERRPEVAAQARRVAEALKQGLAGKDEAAGEVPAARAATAAVSQLKGRYDGQHGGFGRGHKFPSPSNLFLLWRVAEAGDERAGEMVVETLRKMGRGAIYDQLDGGFHRYTLDAAWRIPHFEKMLYDNAHLGELLAVTAVANDDPELERLARGTFDFVLREMTLPNGAFKSAIDAETDGVEGAYYIWTREELEAALGEEGFELLAPIYGFGGEPNVEDDHYTLYLTDSLAAHARRLGLSRRELLERLEPHLERLRRVRSRRPFPLVDDKVLADWNGMMIAALARGGERLAEERYVEAARKAASFLLTLRDGDGVQLHAWRNGEAKIRAFLDDYAFLVRGLLALAEVTGEERWLREAERLSGELERRLRDPRGGYFMSEGKPDLLLRVRSTSDGAIPSGNGIAVLNLLRIAERTGRAIYRERAAAALKAFGPDLEAYPAAAPTVALAVHRYRSTPSAATIRLAARTSASETIEGLAEEIVRAAATLAGEPAVDGWRPIRVSLEIRDGWHVNANPASLDFLIPTQIEGRLRQVVYPPGETFRFSFAEEELSVYSGRTTIRGQVGPDEPSLRLIYQACDDRRCLPPVTETLTVEP